MRFIAFEYINWTFYPRIVKHPAAQKVCEINSNANVRGRGAQEKSGSLTR